MSLYDERIKLCHMMDTCRTCNRPPEIVNDARATSLKHQWCLVNCELQPRMKEQIQVIEQLQREDRRARGVEQILEGNG